MIALPRLSAPRFGIVGLRAIVGNRYVGLGAAALLFAGAVAALVTLLGPMTAGPPHARIGLAGALKHAPPGWREALSPATGALAITEDIVRLSERPLAPLAGVSWNAGGEAKPVAGAL